MKPNRSCLHVRNCFDFRRALLLGLILIHKILDGAANFTKIGVHILEKVSIAQQTPYILTDALIKVVVLR